MCVFLGLSSPTRYNPIPMVTQAPALQLQPQLITQVGCQPLVTLHTVNLMLIFKKKKQLFN